MSRVSLWKIAGLSSRLDLEGEIIPTPGQSDDSINLILDAGIAFTSDLFGLTWEREKILCDRSS